MHAASLVARLDAAHSQHGFARVLETGANDFGIGGFDREHHAHPAIEGPRHFGGFDIPLGLEERHQARLLPAIGFDMGMRTLGQDAGDVFQQAAAGDMRHGVDQPVAHKRQQAAHVDPRRFDQCVDQQAVAIEQGRAVEFPALVLRQPPHQRITVRVHA